MSLLLLMGSVFGLAFVPLRASQDEWWHLKTGQWIWQNGHLPLHDIFTYTGENLRWHNHEWLSQLVFYIAYRTGQLSGFQGLTGLILWKTVVVMAAFGLVAAIARLRGLRWIGACIVAVIAADISRRTIFPRPPIFSYGFLALALLGLYAWKCRYLQFRWLWLLVPMTVIWANFHGMVLLAFIASGAFAGGELLENLTRWIRSGDPERPSLRKSLVTIPVLKLSVLTLALVIAAMCQPAGYHLFFLGRNFTADPLLQNIIQEMQPTPGALRWTDAGLSFAPPGFWTFWLSLVAIAGLLILSRFRMAFGADYLLLAFFAYQAVMHWRLLPLFAIVAAGPVADLITARWKPRPWADPLLLAVLTALIVWFNFGVSENGTFFERNRQMFNGETTNNSDYPEPLMDYIIEADLPDRMFSDSNYCGYAIWRLSPEHHKLFTDARFDLFGSRFIREERVVFYAAEKGDRIGTDVVTEGWNSILARYGVNFLVFRPIDRPYLHRALVASGGWQMVYYYVPPEAQESNWPLEANHVWVRKSELTESIAARSEAIFRRQFPSQVVPAQVNNVFGATPLSPSDWKINLQ